MENNILTKKFEPVIKLPQNCILLKKSIYEQYVGCVTEREEKMITDDNLNNKIERIVKWIYQSPKRGLLLCGTVGNGKTTMLRALYNVFKNSSYLYTTQTVYENYRINDAFREHLKSSKILFLDDLKEEHAIQKNYGESFHPVTDLLEYRYMKNALTIISTNCTVEELHNAYGDRFYDRLKGMYNIIYYTTPSYRR